MERLWIELTERCNLFCKHCFVRRNLNDKTVQSQEMSTGFFCQVLTDAAELGCKWVEFTGGEVFVRNDFDKIYTHAHEVGLSTSVTSNMTLLTDRIIELWDKYPPSDLKTSIYGWDEESYETVVCKRGTFKLFYTNMRKLVERGFHFKALVPAHPLLVKNSSKIQEFARELGAELPVQYGWELMLHLRRDVEASNCIRGLRLSPVEAARLRMNFPKLVLNDLRLIKQGLNSSSLCDDRMFHCVGGSKLLALNAYGFLQPCRPIHHPDLLYDLKQGSLDHALLDHFPRICDLRINYHSACEKCTHCILRPACSSCPATSWIENGSLDEPTQYYCDVIHQEAYWLGILPTHMKGWETEGSFANANEH
ncbi:MAG: radical SAM protein [Anaerolineae bacterium]|nr:radical SAM protein [Anaerolineae bacterium]